VWLVLNYLLSLNPRRFARAEDRRKYGEYNTSYLAKWVYWREIWTLGLFLAFNIIMLVLGLQLFFWHVQFGYAIYSSTGALDVFEVCQPVTFAPISDNRCDLDMLLMEHSFGESYGVPFVGKQCLERFAGMEIVLTSATSREL
jgi:hypothetical protein